MPPWAATVWGAGREDFGHAGGFLGPLARRLMWREVPRRQRRQQQRRKYGQSS